MEWSQIIPFINANEQTIKIASLIFTIIFIVVMVVSVRAYKAFMNTMPKFFIHFIAIVAEYCDAHPRAKKAIIISLVVIISVVSYIPLL